MVRVNIGHPAVEPAFQPLGGPAQGPADDRTAEARRFRSRRDPGVARVHRLRPEDPRPRARALPAREADRLHAPFRRLPAVPAEHGLPQHDLDRPAARLSGQPRIRAPHRGLHPLERDGDGGARQPQVVRVRWPHRDLRVGCHALRGRLQPFLARAVGEASGRHDLHPGSCIAGHLCACLPRGPAHRGAAAPLPAGSRRRRTLVLSASLADAGFLAVPDRVDGPRPDAGDLPGALPALHGASRPGQAVGPQDLGLPRRRRDGRAGVDGRADDAGAREARQPGVRHQLQPAATRRPGARQRQDHPGARGGVPRRRLERHQGALGRSLGSAAREGRARGCCAA